MKRWAPSPFSSTRTRRPKGKIVGEKKGVVSVREGMFGQKAINSRQKGVNSQKEDDTQNTVAFGENDGQ